MKIDIDKNIALKSFDSLTMTSKEVAELCDKQHRNVLVDVEKLLDYYKEIYTAEKSALLISLSNYVASNGKSNKQYVLSKDAVLDLITGYSLPHRHAVNQRWLQLEQDASEEKIRAEARQKARLDAPRLTDALKTHLEELGKGPKWYHYANEHNMIYRAIFKKTCKQLLDKLNLGPDESLRDHLTAGQICLVEELQVADKVLIEAGVEYSKRKEMLEKVVQRRALGYVRIGESTIGEP